MVTVLPTRVGVYLGLEGAYAMMRSSPHAGGGVPDYQTAGGGSWPFSPRGWGCTEIAAKI